MKAKQIQETLEEMFYWDAPVLELTIQYFGDEVILIFEDSPNNIKLLFCGCYKVILSTYLDDRKKPIRDLSYSQLHYFLQDIKVTEQVVEDIEVLNCIVYMPPLSLEICCSTISLSNVQKLE